jgi:hypothetical protein
MAIKRSQPKIQELLTHGGDQNTSFTLDDTLDDVLDVLRATNILLVIGSGEKHGILHEGITVVFCGIFVRRRIIGRLLSSWGISSALVNMRTNSEDDGKKELELLPGHRLEVHRIIMRLDAEALALHVVNTNAGKIEERGPTLCNGQTNAFLVILTVLIPEPVMAKYSATRSILVLEE